MDIEPNRPLVTAARFVGRKVELGELGRLLKQSNSVTAVHGMPGVGKTFLTEHFAQQNRDRFPQHVRIGLRPDESRTVDELLGTLAAQLHTESRDLVAELAATRTLVIIDNVDSAPLVGRVMDLWSHLARIPLLVIGRYDELGREAGWLRVELRPYEGYREPLEQLNKEGVDTTGSSMQEDLCAMIDALGHLPLALSLAAGHLRNHAYTPRGFVDELRRRGLSVVPADPSDLRRFGDDSARAVLRTSFELSWEHLRRELHAQEHDTDEVGTMLRGLCHMAHGLACPLGPNLAAAACGLSEDLARKVLATATTLSLVQRSVGSVAWSLHPLIAEFLRASTIEIDLDAVKRSTSEWFLERLRRAGQRNDEQAKVRKELTDEGEALFLWLSDQMGRDAYTAVEVGFDFAKDCGPYIAWAEACKRAETAMLDLKEQSTRLWCLATFAMSAGELDTAMRAAEHMVDVETRLSNERGIAHAKEKIADILQARGDLDRALQILENDVLPVHESTGNAREKAVTMGRVADIVRIRGDPNRALQILENDVLLVYERIG
ncbi:MAG: ATP-binding protein, partial [Myxococcales bacterium]|nr:ATP-binding protein [Myxococcales bacterium]